MSTELTQQRAAEAETLYFSMFPVDSTDEFRRFLLYVVYTAICEDDGITVNKIKWKLNNELSLKPDDIEIAINALSNPRLFNAVSKFHVRGRKRRDPEKEIVHLRLRKNQQGVIQAWVSRLLEEYPEYRNISSA